MINKTLKKSFAALTTATMVAALAVAIPTAARADGLTCSEVATSADGAIAGELSITEPLGAITGSGGKLTP